MANLEHLAILKQGVEVWNQWRKESPDVRPDLTGAQMIGIELETADLTMTGLAWANLYEANLAWADLYGADLSGANLTKTDLSKANLHKANLYKANLDWTSLSVADLNMADLSMANCIYTIFANVDLSQVNGLEAIQHIGPSFVDIHTLTKSKGKIPRTFLRGCGVPEELIKQLPYLFDPSTIQYYSCFISYSHADKEFAQKVYERLYSHGINCWLDEHQMLPGQDIFAEVDRGIRLWDKVLLCASENSLSSWWVDNELETLFEKERGLMKERGEKVRALIPLDLDGFLFSPACPTPKKTQIQSRLAANFKGWESDHTIFEREIEKVIRALRTDEGREPPPPSKL